MWYLNYFNSYKKDFLKKYIKTNSTIYYLYSMYELNFVCNIKISILIVFISKTTNVQCVIKCGIQSIII